MMRIKESPAATCRRQGAGVKVSVGGAVGIGLDVKVALGGPGVTDGPGDAGRCRGRGLRLAGPTEIRAKRKQPQPDCSRNCKN